MITLRYPNDIEGCGTEPMPSCVLALGFFDGMHMAHRKLISIARKRADELGISLAVFTFPAESDAIKSGKARIYSTEKKLLLFEELGVDIVILADFSLVRGISAKDFVSDCIVKELNAEAVVCGYNFKFGKAAKGNASLLKAESEALGKECIIIPKYSFGATPLSSTIIKDALREGNVELAASELGLPFFIEGQVCHGDGRGAKLGIPTVNIDIAKQTELIKRGVYLTCAYVCGERYPAITNVGICPTFEEREAHSETFIFNFSGNLYDEKIRIYFLSFLRAERCFESEKELIMQIEVDKAEALKKYGEIKWQELGLS